MTKLKVLNDYPQWIAANQKLVELQQEFDATDKEIGRIVSRRESEDDRDVFGDAATALLRGETVTAAPVAGNDEHERQLRFRRKVLSQAIDMQKRELVDLKNKLSNQVCTDFQPEYRKLVAGMAEAARKLQAAVEAERTARDALQAGGVSVDYLRVCFPMVGGRIETFLQNAKQLGYI